MDVRSAGDIRDVIISEKSARGKKRRQRRRAKCPRRAHQHTHSAERNRASTGVTSSFSLVGVRELDFFLGESWCLDLSAFTARLNDRMMEIGSSRRVAEVRNSVAGRMGIWLTVRSASDQEPTWRCRSGESQRERHTSCRCSSSSRRCQQALGPSPVDTAWTSTNHRTTGYSPSALGLRARRLIASSTLGRTSGNLLASPPATRSCTTFSVRSRRPTPCCCQRACPCVLHSHHASRLW